MLAPTAGFGHEQQSLPVFCYWPRNANVLYSHNGI